MQERAPCADLALVVRMLTGRERGEVGFLLGESGVLVYLEVCLVRVGYLFIVPCVLVERGNLSYSEFNLKLIKIA